MMSTATDAVPIRPWYNAARVTVPTGACVPDLAIKRSLVLDRFNAERAHARSQAVQRGRLQQQSRAYAGAEQSRLTGDWSALNTSADSEILTSLRALRARSRQLVRDNPYAKQAVRIIVNNVIGGGIGMQAQVLSAGGKLQAKVNDSIEQEWLTWCDKRTCHTAGVLGFADIERVVMAQLVTAGEAIVRKIRQPFGNGVIPLALEVIESDRLIDFWQTARAPNGNAIRMGVEVDEWHRPTAYWFTPRHPGDYSFASFNPSAFMRVPAEDIIHLYVIDRWPQTRGEPWMHAALRTLHDAGGTEEAIVVKARAAANIVGFIRSPELLAADETVKGRQVLDTEPGTWQRLLPGEDVAGFSAAVADPALDPFLRYLLRKAAVGIGTSYESISRDYSQSNYSSSRLALLDDRAQWRILQGFFGRNLRADIHAEFLDAATLVGAVKTGPDYFGNPRKYRAVRFKPRGWSWIDPTKEVAAYKEAVRNGFMTQADVIAQTADGVDVEDVLKARREELDMAAELGLVFDSDPLQVNSKGQAQPAEPEGETAAGDHAGAPGDQADASGTADPTDTSEPQ